MKTPNCDQEKCTRCGGCCLASPCMITPFREESYITQNDTRIHNCKFLSFDDNNTASCKAYHCVNSGGSCTNSKKTVDTQDLNDKISMFKHLRKIMNSTKTPNKNKFTTRDAKDIISAWESLPGGRYSNVIIQKWLTSKMYPAIERLRSKISQKIKK